ncbi:chemotaxis protein CheC [Anaerosacchariphilus polymeriproducens]|uniref:Chemotaxis protein CheC n=1 Tax=Anaerosacchariphilus polymeriproducens TaxID=1812858 RepID=A0A371AS67_9FIRM|nr:chemotaxis protein CheC [Anaerosacchariphilus polymeriproducens]RDU22409.1 chemotaxis protein CheC [Anaerosacchariphilus polymeriproducens]
MTKFNFEQVNDLYIDVLKEIGNIGAGNATTSLAKMLGIKINMSVPNVQLLSIQELTTALGNEEDTIVGIFLELEKDVNGSMMFLLDLKSAHYLANHLQGKPIDNEADFDDMDISAMKEIGNIIAGSYLSAISTMTQLVITSSIPYLTIDMAAAILSVPAIQFGQVGDNALLIETTFGNDTTLSGYFILLPGLDSYDKILTSLGIEL